MHTLSNEIYCKSPVQMYAKSVDKGFLHEQNGGTIYLSSILCKELNLNKI